MGIKKTEGAKIKKEEHKRKASFHCPFIEAMTNIGKEKKYIDPQISNRKSKK